MAVGSIPDGGQGGLWAAAWTALAALVLVGACVQEPYRSVVQTQADGLRTFTVIRAMDGAAMLCPASAAVDPVSGIFRGDPAARPETSWIDVEGRRQSVVWPDGFSLRFEPEAKLYDDHDRVVARDGGVITFPQVNTGDHAGTFEDPYIARGLLFDGCYPFVEG